MDRSGIWLQDRDSIALIEAFYNAGKPVAAVCHAPGVLRHAKGADGQPLVKGKKVTGFTNSEEEARATDQGRAVPGGGRVEGQGR